MLVFRSVEAGDLDQLVHLATLTDYGLSTLPTDRDYLKKKVLQSTQSFERSPDEPGGEAYLFVAEDLDSGQVVGTSGAVSRVGGFEPFYMYEIKLLHDHRPWECTKKSRSCT